jgi:CMP-N,N'-diacetyllegionaminic acid synthase
MRSLAIIPARGGSKRVERKNLASIGDDCLLKLALDSALPCDAVVVSSDDDEIRARAASGMAGRGPAHCVHHRKPEHATDTANLEDVIADVVYAYGDGADAIVLLQPTSPFRTAAHVASALAILESSGCDSVVSVTRLHSLHPTFSGELYDGRYWPRKTSPDGGRMPSASLQHLVYENGAIYAFTRKWWNGSRTRMGGDMRPLVMHWSEAVEVDTMEDLESARALARGRA